MLKAWVQEYLFKQICLRRSLDLAATAEVTIPDGWGLRVGISRFLNRTDEWSETSRNHVTIPRQMG